MTFCRDDEVTVSAMRKLAKELAHKAEEHYSTSAVRRDALVTQMIIAHQEQTTALRQTMPETEARISQLESKAVVSEMARGRQITTAGRTQDRRP